MSGKPPPNPKGRPPGSSVTEELFAAVLSTYAVNGLKRKSCELNGISYDAIWNAMDRRRKEGDDSWVLRWEAAFDEYRESLKAEAHRRAVEGVERPVFGSLGQGAGTGVVGHVTEYSDALLLAKLRANVPEYRQALDVKVSEGAGPAGERPTIMAGLSVKAQREIRAIIMRDLAEQRAAAAEQVEVTPVPALALEGPEEDADADEA